MTVHTHLKSLLERHTSRSIDSTLKPPTPKPPHNHTVRRLLAATHKKLLPKVSETQAIQHYSPPKVSSHLSEDRPSIPSATPQYTMRLSPADILRYKKAYRLEALRLRSEYHLDSKLEAQSFITTFIHSQTEEHIWPNMRVTCDLPMAELRDLGRLPRSEGIRACGRLIRAPVISQKLGEALWEYLANDIGREKGEGVDEQSLFESEIAAQTSDEITDETGEQEHPCPTLGAPRCCLCAARGNTHACRLPPDILAHYTRAVPYDTTATVGEMFWQREERICPCTKTYEDASDSGSSDAHGSETSSEGTDAGASPSSPSSMRSRFSQIFVWGRRSS